MLQLVLLCLTALLSSATEASPAGGATTTPLEVSNDYCVEYTLTNLAQNLVQIDLSSYFNNQGFSTYPGEGAFSVINESYVADSLPQGGSYTSTKFGITYSFPGYQGLGANDNVLCQGQVIPVPQGSYFSAHLLIAGDEFHQQGVGNLTFTYTDNTTALAEMRSEPFWSFLTIFKGEINMPSFFTNNKTDYNTSNIFEHISSLDSSKTLSSITLPNTPYTNSSSRLHVFSLTLLKGSGIEVQYVRPTQKHSADRVQIVEVAINNVGPDWIAGDGVEVVIAGPGVVTVEPGYLKRLRPGDQRRIQVGVVGCGNITAEVALVGDSFEYATTFDGVSFGLEDYTEDLDSLNLHEAPNWFEDAKFGIFIHWGVYSVPAFGNHTPFEVYAEWYWWYGHHRAADKADIYDYHLRTYGPDIVYDDFFSNFTGALFDAKAWVDLFAEAGAQYFVFTSKHHDGFAMFDTGNTTGRNSLNYGPHRDVLRELFDAAKTYQPHLHRGTYFSLPEWYNPDFGPYGYAETAGNASVSWPGILANNPYTGAVEPYTGRLPINDFIEDLMLPQMNKLAYDYETEIMWCDCGGANASAAFASNWFNWASTQGREVTINDRCGLAKGSDYDTPEYTTFSSVSERKWESNSGMDPFSYGYNADTKPNAYLNASGVVSSLVDMVSKNGNFLLDIGPKHDGTVDETEVAHLKAAGKWIHANGEAIFNTTYWYVLATSLHASIC